MIVLGDYKAERPTITDCFAGGGGTSTGTARSMSKRGYGPGKMRLIAINHDPDAIKTHELNHPWAEHIHDDVERVNPKEVLQGERLLALIGSPPCTHFSMARGGKPRDYQSRATPNYLLDWIKEGNPAQAERLESEGRMLREINEVFPEIHFVRHDEAERRRRSEISFRQNNPPKEDE